MKKHGSLSAADILERYYGQDLSKRELEIGRLAVAGIATHDIATRMYLTVNTVKTHLKHVFRKTDTENRNDLYRKLISMQFQIRDGDARNDLSTVGPHLITRDPLTGALTAASFRYLMESAMEEVRVAHSHVSAIQVALERPQPAEGAANAQLEQLLVGAASLLLTSLRKTDLVCRWTATDFLVLLPHCNVAVAQQIANRLVQKMHHLAESLNLTLAVAAGIVSTEEGCTGAAELLAAVSERTNAMRAMVTAQPQASLAPAYMSIVRCHRSAG